jgi:hypothetical protein
MTPYHQVLTFSHACENLQGCCNHPFYHSSATTVFQIDPHSVVGQHPIITCPSTDVTSVASYLLPLPLLGLPTPLTLFCSSCHCLLSCVC